MLSICIDNKNFGIKCVKDISGVDGDILTNVQKSECVQGLDLLRDVRIFTQERKRKGDKRKGGEEGAKKRKILTGEETRRPEASSSSVASSEMARSPVVTSPTFLRRAYEKTKCHNDQGRFGRV